MTFQRLLTVKSLVRIRPGPVSCHFHKQGRAQPRPAGGYRRRSENMADLVRAYYSKRPNSVEFAVAPRAGFEPAT